MVNLLLAAILLRPRRQMMQNVASDQSRQPDISDHAQEGCSKQASIKALSPWVFRQSTAAIGSVVLTSAGRPDASAVPRSATAALASL
eukprot:CAMPEP_0198606058 /NCGR_PEP_ID=MMETSP1462-20131121/154705_1 /TAXON_ID=1333877 /ORGANISM="Brandtodinium nutriculum, Strain RCC3387" /LENGTH=87 /DNA_ID=CAMNT_0044337861 /DNA_START=871 /DNA_END=1135 /DNA_ORIENTATION=-